MQLSVTYQKLLSVPEQRLTMIQDVKSLNINSIDRGILFVMAKWSAASQVAFRALNKSLSSFPDLGDLRLYIVDTDDDQIKDFFTAINDVPAGKGETYWILKGKILHRLSGYHEESVPALQRNTRETL
jgi:hypothetical protein